MITYLFYTSVLIISVTLAFISSQNSNLRIRNNQNNKLDWFFILSFFVIVFTVGLRGESVGTDSENYKNFYIKFIDNDNGLFSVFNNTYSIKEPGFLIVNYISSKISNNFSVLFVIMSFLAWIFIFNSFSENKHIFYIVIYFTFVIGFYSSTMNGIRQAVSASIFLFSFKYISDYNFKKYFISILLAVIFHFSALLLIPFYFIVMRLPRNPVFWYSITLLALFFNNLDLTFTNYILTKIPGGYSSYLKYTQFNPQNINSMLSIGFLYQYTIGLFTIYFYSKQKYLGSYYRSIYFASFIYTILLIIFWSTPVYLRFAYYFQVFQIITLSIITKHYILKRDKITTVFIFAMFTLLFYYKIYVSENGMYPFVFSFQV